MKIKNLNNAFEREWYSDIEEITQRLRQYFWNEFYFISTQIFRIISIK